MATQLGVQQYRTGIIDFNRVFNLETTQVQQRDQLAIAAGNIALNLVNVYRALGGGWELRCQKEQLQRSTDSEHGDARGARGRREPLSARNRYQNRYRRLGRFLDPGGKLLCVAGLRSPASDNGHTPEGESTA